MKSILPLLLLLIYPGADRSFAQEIPPAKSNDLDPVLLERPVKETSPSSDPLLLPLNGTEQVRLDLVNCRWSIDCGLARFLLPASAFVNQWELQFDNPGTEPISVLSTAVLGRGEQTGYQLTSKAIAISDTEQSISDPAKTSSDLSGAIVLPANQIVSLPLAFNRSAIPPDRYTGSIYLTIEKQQNRMTLPLNLSVRTGPFIPLVILAIGIILGRVSRYMKERGEPLADALQDLNRLKQDIVATEQLTKDEKDKLLVMANRVRTSVGREEFEEVEQEIEAIKNRLELMIDLQIMDESLAGKEQHPDVKKAKVSLEQAKKNVINGQEREAVRVLNELQTTKLISFMGDEESEERKQFAECANKAVVTANRINQSSTASVKKSRFRKILIFLSGLPDDIRAEATLWVAKPVLSLSLLVGLSAVGLNSLYIQNGKTFGANPFADYFGLILWGLSADIASRSLSNLGGLDLGQKPSKEGANES